MTGAWTDILRFVWPIASIVTPFMMGAFVWWFRKEFVSMADFIKLKAERETAVAAVEVRVDVVERRQDRAEEAAKAFRADYDQPPSRMETMRNLANVSERLAAVDATVNGIQVQATTTNRLLQLLLEREGRR